MIKLPRLLGLLAALLTGKFDPPRQASRIQKAEAGEFPSVDHHKRNSIADAIVDQRHQTTIPELQAKRL